MGVQWSVLRRQQKLSGLFFLGPYNSVNVHVDQRVRGPAEHTPSRSQPRTT
jgi:hypothetical protein